MTLKRGDLVEVLDTTQDDIWLVRRAARQSDIGFVSPNSLRKRSSLEGYVYCLAFSSMAQVLHISNRSMIFETFNLRIQICAAYFCLVLASRVFQILSDTVFDMIKASSRAKPLNIIAEYV